MGRCQASERWLMLFQRTFLRPQVLVCYLGSPVCKKAAPAPPRTEFLPGTGLSGVLVVLPDLLCLWPAGSLGKLTLWSS